jgi:hypothetical protein
MENPLDPMKVLRERLEKATGALGLELHQFALLIGGEHEPDAVQAVFIVNADVVGRDTEQAEYDDKFEQITKDFQIDKQQEKENDAIANLEEMRRRFEGGGGFLASDA